MRPRARILTLFIALALVCRTAHADEMRTRLQGALEVVRQRSGLHGVVASVVTPDGAWTLASGDSHAGVPMRADHLLAIGSQSKTFAAILLLRFQERGLLSLDTRIGRFLAPIANVDTTITVRQLLQHTSGLGEYADSQAYRDSTLARPNRLWSTSELVRFIPAPQFAPGASWSYCNTNYLIAGMIAQQVGGAPLHVLVRNEITAPLGLDSTRYVPQELMLGALAHRWINGQDLSARPMTAEWSGAWAAGAIISTAGEMTELYGALFSGRLLTSASLNQMLQFTGPQDYGLGISRKTVGGYAAIGHSGEIRGFMSTTVRVPALSSTVVVLTNDEPGTPMAFADTLVRLLASSTLSAPPSGTSSTRLLQALAPNPAAGPVRIVCASPRAGEGELAVFRVDGRRVRTVSHGSWAAGPHELVWDGRDDAGREVGPGVYLVRVTVPGARETRRIVRLR
jgi:D-alanyl-D-alanine carboxypeptidase